MHKGDCEPVARTLVVLAEDLGKADMAVAWGVESGGGDGMLVFRTDLAYLIGIISGTLTGTKN